MNIPDGETALWAAARLLTVAHAPPVALGTDVTEVVDVTAMHWQALEILNVWFPFWFCLHASMA